MNTNMKHFHVVVPENVQAGQDFVARIGSSGQMMVVTCPENASPGTRLDIALEEPTKQAPDTTSNSSTMQAKMSEGVGQLSNVAGKTKQKDGELRLDAGSDACSSSRSGINKGIASNHRSAPPSPPLLLPASNVGATESNAKNGVVLERVRQAMPATQAAAGAAVDHRDISAGGWRIGRPISKISRTSWTCMGTAVCQARHTQRWRPGLAINGTKAIVDDVGRAQTMPQ